MFYLKKSIYILALEMASPGNQHCANCIGHFRSLCLSFVVFVNKQCRLATVRRIVVSGVRRMNEVNQRRARLVPGWVNVSRRVHHLGM